MSVPGCNLLSMASRIIAQKSFTYLQYLSRSTNGIGMQVPVYASPVTLRGSIQPIPRELMMTLGLDLTKHYENIYVSNRLIDIRRDVSSDKFQFDGATFQGLSMTKWIDLDGWNAILVVEVPS